MTNDPTRRAIAAGAVVAIAALALAACPGCNPASGHNPDASPIVRPDSERGKKAIAETEELLRLRKQQEAKARARRRGIPGDV
jgi:hypothetical protein